MPRETIAIAGATGFVGRVLINSLLPQHNIIGLTRGTLPGPCVLNPGHPCPVKWRTCDLYSLSHCEHSLIDVDTAIYLVHSMLPSAKLTQGSFQDMDLLMADNFARAAKKNHVKRILYLGGFVPEDAFLSRHIRSRLEVQQVLASHGVPVTALRAGIIIGPGGSSARMIFDIIKNLPIIPCPPITNSLTQPIALSDVIEIFNYVIENPHYETQSFDIGGPEILTYKNLIRAATNAMGLKRTLVPLPFFGPALCKRLLAVCTTAPYELTSPLVESLKHNMVQKSRYLQDQMGQKGVPLSQALYCALTETPEGDRHRCCLPEPSWKKKFAKQKVRSVQRLPLPPGKSLQWMANEYGKFHHTIFKFLVRGDVSESNVTSVKLRLFGISLLELTFSPTHSYAERAFFFITGGILAQQQVHRKTEHRPRLEFRRVFSGDFVIVALHDFVPALPWFLYICTQALAHVLFMKLFSRKMKSLSKSY